VSEARATSLDSSARQIQTAPFVRRWTYLIDQTALTWHSNGTSLTVLIFPKKEAWRLSRTSGYVIDR
jgi:hypothetical protein